MSAPLLLITLDGPAGVGKSTIAKALARELGLAYLDTGAMFRAVALQLGAQGVDQDDATLRARLQGLRFALQGAGEATQLVCNGRVLGAEIRTETVGMLASTLAKRAPVRELLREQQQALGRETALVAEGRDMGTVVFPQASCKFFLDAAPEVRARRRALQLQELGAPCPPLKELTEQIRARDEQDRTRELAPLRPAQDAVLVDTGDLSIAGVLERVLERVRRC